MPGRFEVFAGRRAWGAEEKPISCTPDRQLSRSTYKLYILDSVPLSGRTAWTSISCCSPTTTDRSKPSWATGLQLITELV